MFPSSTLAAHAKSNEPSNSVQKDVDEQVAHQPHFNDGAKSRT
jgi:hypothetical protein